jgi:cytochrome c-type biogenesis protein CcmF
MGVLGSNLYQLEAEHTLAPGEAIEVGGYVLTYTGPGMAQEPDKSVLYTAMDVTRDGRFLGGLQPSKQVFRLREDQPRTIPAVLHRPLEDVYVLLGTYSAETSRATFRVYVNPLIGLVWLGMLIVVVGTLVAAWPDSAEYRVLNTELTRLLGARPALP